MCDVVRTERHGAVLVITIDRPDARNAIDSGVTAGLVAAIQELEDDPVLSVGVLAGAGGTFSAGMDLKEFARSGPPKGLFRLLRRGSDKVLIAAIEGTALGGGFELALVCDLLVVAEDARIGLPEVGRGLFAGGGGLLRLPKRLPYSVAAEAALTGEPLDVATAHRLGLVARVTSPGDALTVALGLADAISRNAPLAVAATKQLVRAAVAGAEDEFWPTQAAISPTVFDSQDAREGPRAFAEKRLPVWSGS